MTYHDLEQRPVRQIRPAAAPSYIRTSSCRSGRQDDPGPYAAYLASSEMTTFPIPNEDQGLHKSGDLA